MDQAMNLYESGVGKGVLPSASNKNLNLSFSSSYLQAYSKIPCFKDSIYEELEADWQQSKE